MSEGQPRVLCVDDEPNVLSGLARVLRREFDVVTAEGAAQGLRELGRDQAFAVVVSDMRMPGMDGAAFLARVRKMSPASTRMLLTGYAEIDAAIAAVNEGNVFRFLTKPCPRPVLLRALREAVEQHRLVTAERILLHQTLLGAVKTLSYVLSLASPQAFGRATRAKRAVSELAQRMGLADTWHLEVGALLSQIGSVALPPQTAEKLYHGRPLTHDERQMVDRLPMVAEELLANIPRLESVREILLYQDKRYDGGGPPEDDVRGEQLPLGARMLKVILDHDQLTTRGLTSEHAFNTLRSRENTYDPELLEIYADLRGCSAPSQELREVDLAHLRPGMTLADDVTTGPGLLLVARGQEVTLGLVERLRNFSRKVKVNQPIMVVVERPTTELRRPHLLREAPSV